MRTLLSRRSFRTRLAGLSFLVSGLALLAFAIPAWVLIGRIDLRHIDNEVRVRALPHLAWHPDNRHWQRLEEELRYTYGASSQQSACLLVKNREGRVIQRSASWPRALDPARFPRTRGRASGMRLELPPPPPGPPGAPGPPPPPPAARLRQPEAHTWRDGRHSWRLAVMGNEFYTVVVGVNLANHQQYMLTNGLALLAALPLAALLAATGGWLLAGRALRPVSALTDTAAVITAQGLSQRLATAGEDEEFARLISVFNEMLERLERSFQQATRFSADAAHELKTPLAVLQGELEQALQQAPLGSREQQVYGDLLEEVQRLKVIIRKLLLLSLADAGRLELHREPCDLTAAVKALREDMEVLGPGLEIGGEVAPGVQVPADAELLEQVLQNLASNAVKYNRPQGKINCRLETVGRTARLVVGNTGPGIPLADRDRVFERFYRANKARDRRVEGTGLGLSLSREIARAHGGDLRLEQSGTDWTVFALTWPLSGPEPAGEATPDRETPR